MEFKIKLTKEEMKQAMSEGLIEKMLGLGATVKETQETEKVEEKKAPANKATKAAKATEEPKQEEPKKEEPKKTETEVTDSDLNEKAQELKALSNADAVKAIISKFGPNIKGVPAAKRAGLLAELVAAIEKAKAPAETEAGMTEKQFEELKGLAAKIKDIEGKGVARVKELITPFAEQLSKVPASKFDEVKAILEKELVPATTEEDF